MLFERRISLRWQDLDQAEGADAAQADSADAAAATRDMPRLIPGVAHIHRQRRDPAFGVGLYNLWHDTLNLQLKEAEAFVLPYMDGQHSRKQLATMLRDALSRGAVPGTDGKSMKGQRNLDAHADKILGKLLELLMRQGLLR